MTLVAGRQENVISGRQLREIGYRPSAIDRLVRSGRLTRRFPAVFSLTPTLSRIGQFWAAVLACGKGAALSHDSAGHMHGVRQHRWGRPHVTVPRTGARDREGIRVHGSRALRVVEVDGLPVTDITLTLTDLADTLTPSALQLAVATAERKGLIDRATYQPLPGRRSIMDQPHVFTRSENERALLKVCQAFGLDLPLMNQTIGDIEVDAYWPGARFALEIDAWHTHGNPIVFERERLRDERLDLDHGVKVRRVTDTRLHAEPAAIARLIARCIGPSS